jgi:hypothetical protein
MTEPSEYWASRRAAVVEWLPRATRSELEAFALRHHDRAESAAWCISEEFERADMAAQRQASHAIADSLDWGAQSRRPSFAELQRRRAVA